MKSEKFATSVSTQTTKRLILHTTLLLGLSASCLPLQAETQKESIQDTTKMAEVVVTGTRNATDIRHLPMTVNTISREQLTAGERTSVLPTIMEEVPGLLVTSRGVMGYGVSTGGSGSINVRGLSSGAGQMLVLIDGHPQYQGIFGHGIADSYQTMIADRVEVLRGRGDLPAHHHQCRCRQLRNGAGGGP